MKILFLNFKKYWKICALIIGAIFAFFFFRSRENSFLERIKTIQKLHDEEIKKINIEREKERELHKQNEKKLRETLALVQEQYDLAKKNLDDKKKKMIVSIIKEHGNDPDSLAQELSNMTGFKIILPEEGEE